LATKTEALLADDASITEIDELRPLIAEAQERGFLTFEQIAAALEEVEVTKEQVAELHHYLDEQGIEVVAADGRPAVSEGGRFEPEAARTKDSPEAARKPG
jgi:RNA polymerase primary sigma factor